MKPAYSIVIGQAFSHLDDHLKPCIDSIRKHSDPELIEIIVVANGCDQATLDWLAEQQDIRTLKFDQALGFSRAYNEGIKAANGVYVILLNNDVILLDQPKNRWLSLLEQPFLLDDKVAATGSLKKFSKIINKDFLLFFCVMIKREMFDKVGMLDPMFDVGGQEDIDWCARAQNLGFKIHQVPSDEPLKVNAQGLFVSMFPIYHVGEGTMKHLPNWQEIFDRNELLLAKRHNYAHYQATLGNKFERAVISADEDMGKYPREHSRYLWAASRIKGKRILEIGCSSGYGLRYFPENIDYTGVDYDARILEYAREQFGESESRRFIHADINKFDLGYYDTIIAFEVLEHLPNGVELAQKLKEHCTVLLCSCPHDEPKGFWGGHHVLHNLTEENFPQFKYQLMDLDGKLVDALVKNHFVDGVWKSEGLMLMEWEQGVTYPEFERVPRILCSISTRDRYDILPLALQAVANQTRKPNKIVIFDDGEHKDLRQHPIYKHIFALFQAKGIEWAVIFGVGKGQHHNHEIANTMGFDFVWRVDDDEAPEPDVLEKLMSHMDKDVGAVGGAVISPGQNDVGGTGKIKDVYHTPNVQWSPLLRVMDVEHLYSSFVYRAGIAHYNLELSPVAHREETLFTYQIFRSGYRLVVDTSAVTYHYRQESGGIRAHNDAFFYEHDEKVFAKFMESWGYKLINNENGLGDNYAFLHILPEIQKKYGHVILGTAYPEVYLGIEDLTIIPVACSQKACKDSVYRWMGDRNWGRSIIDAYKEMYGIEGAIPSLCPKTEEREGQCQESSERILAGDRVCVGG